MLCRVDHGKYHTYHMPWADGTECGSYKTVKKGNALNRRNSKKLMADGVNGKCNSNYDQMMLTIDESYF